MKVGSAVVLLAFCSSAAAYSTGLNECTDTPGHGQWRTNLEILWEVEVVVESTGLPATSLDVNTAYLVNLQRNPSQTTTDTVNGAMFHVLQGAPVDDGFGGISSPSIYSDPRVGTISTFQAATKVIDNSANQPTCTNAGSHSGSLNVAVLTFRWTSPPTWPAGLTDVTFMYSPVVFWLESWVLKKWTSLPIAGAVVTTPTATATASPTRTPSRSPSGSITPSVSPTRTPSRSPSGSNTPSVSPSRSPSRSPAAATSTATASPSRSPSRSPAAATSTATASPSRSPSRSPSANAATATATASPSRSPSRSPAAATSTATASPSRSPSRSPGTIASSGASSQPASTPTASPVVPCAVRDCGSRGQCMAVDASASGSTAGARTVDVCVCSPGWAGAACDSCAAGFESTAAGQCRRPASSVALRGVLRIALAAAASGNAAVSDGASARRARALQALRPSEGIAVDAMVAALNAQVPQGTLVSRLSGDGASTEVTNGWLKLQVAAADATSLDAALSGAAASITNTSSPVHAAMAQAGFSAVNGAACTGSLCFAGGPTAVSLEVLPAAFSGLAASQLPHTETLDGAGNVQLRWGLFSAPGEWASCVTWPAAAPWPEADGAALRGDAPLALVLEMSHTQAHTWLGVGFPNSPTGGMLGATAVIGQPGYKLGSATAGQSVRMPAGAAECPAVLESVVTSLAGGVGSFSLQGRSVAGVSAGPSQRAVVASAAWSTALGDVLPPSSAGAVAAARFVVLVAPPSAGDTDAVNGVLRPDGGMRLLWATGAHGVANISAHSSSRGDVELVAVTATTLGAPLQTGGATEYDSLLLLLHVVSMVVAWLVCAPVALLLSLLRHTQCIEYGCGGGSSVTGESGGMPRWLCTHIALQCAATLACVGGTVLGVLIAPSHASETHHFVGYALTALMLLQVAAAACRPDKHVDTAHTYAQLQGTASPTRRGTVGIGEALPTVNPLSGVSASPQKGATAAKSPGVGAAVRAQRALALKAEQNSGAAPARHAWQVCHRFVAAVAVLLAAVAGVNGAQLTAYASSTKQALYAGFMLMVLIVAAAALWRAVTACQDAAARRADAVRVGEAVLDVQSPSPFKSPKAASGKHSGRSRASLVGVARGANGSSRFQLVDKANPMATQGLAGGVSPRASRAQASAARASLVGGGYAATGLAGGFAARRKSSAARRLSSVGRSGVYARKGGQLV